MSKFCHKCGSPLQEGVRFCSNCGTQVAAPVQPTPVPVAPVAPTPAAVTPVAFPDEPTVAIWNDIMSDNPTPSIPTEEPAPAAEEPVTVFYEPAPVAETPAPVEQPAPVVSEPAPVYQDPTPVYRDPVPVYRDPVPVSPAPTPKKTRAPKIRKPRGVGRTLLAIVLCFIMTILSFAAIVLNGVQTFVSQDTLETAMEEVVTELDELPAIGLYTNIELPEDATILDELAAVSEHMGIPMSKKDIQKYMEESELISAIMDSTTGSISDMLQGKTDSGLDTEDIIDLLYQDQDLIEDYCGETIDDEMIQSIAQTVEDYGVLDLTNTKSMRKELGGVYTVIELTMSPTIVVVLWCVVGLFVVLLFLTNRFNLGQTCSDTGIVLVVTSGLNLALAFLGFDLLLSLLKDVPGADLLNVLASSFANSWMDPCFTVLIIGAVLILLGIVIHLITRPKKNA